MGQTHIRLRVRRKELGMLKLKALTAHLHPQYVPVCVAPTYGKQHSQGGGNERLCLLIVILWWVCNSILT